MTQQDVIQECKDDIKNIESKLEAHLERIATQELRVNNIDKNYETLQKDINSCKDRLLIIETKTKSEEALTTKWVQRIGAILTILTIIGIIIGWLTYLRSI